MQSAYRGEPNSSTSYSAATAPANPTDLQLPLAFADVHSPVVTCATCGRRLVIRVEHFGQEVACCHCGSRLLSSVPGDE